MCVKLFVIHVVICYLDRLFMILRVVLLTGWFNVVSDKPMMPSIPKIQRLIESAWEKGFDKQGSDQLGGRVFNTEKWIGATEIVATLASLRVK